MKFECRAHLWAIIALFVVIHGAMFAFGLSHPDSLMAGDRAGSRLNKIQYVFFGIQNQPADDQHDRPSEPQTLSGRMLATGTPGDYAIHGILYALGGPWLVVAGQLALYFVATLLVYQLALMVGCQPRYALLAVVLYMILPGSLILPHQLASESIFNPLAIIGLFLICSYFERPSTSQSPTLIGGFLALGIAAAIRIQLILYPFVLSIILLGWDRKKRWRHIAALIAVSLFVPVSWAMFVRSQTGQMNVKSHDNNPALEFFKTARKMATVGDFEFDESEYPSGTMSPGRFVSFIAEHPSAYARLKAMHVANLVANPGIYSVVGHHMGLLEGAGDTEFWKGVRNREGYTGVLKEVLRRGPVLAMIIALALLLWGVVLVGTAWGLWIFIRGSRPLLATKLVLLSFAAYNCLIVQVSTDVRWGHRTPIEFLMMICCGLAAQQLFCRVPKPDPPLATSGA